MPRISLRLFLQLVFLAIFLGQIVYLSYYLPQVAFATDDFPQDIKLSLIVAGAALGLLWAIKPRNLKPEPQEEAEEEEIKEESEKN